MKNEIQVSCLQGNSIQALKDSYQTEPGLLVKNPVIFIVGIGALMTTVVVLSDILTVIFLTLTFRSHSGSGFCLFPILPKRC